MPLNNALYQAMLARLGPTDIVSPGEEMSGRYQYDPVRGRQVLDIHDWGESYATNCPYCNDRKRRLYVSHRYGQEDPQTGNRNLRFLRCFNEECFKKIPDRCEQLYGKLFGFINEPVRGMSSLPQPSATPIRLDDNPGDPPPVDWPGTVTPLLDLPESHQANAYLASRGFDPRVTASRWGLVWCSRAREPRLRLAENRIIIPVLRKGVMVGWQGRWPAELNWKEARLNKYQTLTGMRKRFLIYNGDMALSRPFAIVVEGPTSAWPLWPNGCATFGNSVSHHQLVALGEYCRLHPLVIILDPDPVAQAEALRVYERLRRLSPLVARVLLPDKTDPGEFQRRGRLDEMWEIIVSQCEQQSVCLDFTSTKEPPHGQ